MVLKWRQPVEFPLRVVIEILLRLPVKSLLKFRCVAKSWKFLISSHDFSKTHLRYLKSSSNHLKYRITLATNSYGVFVKKNSLDSLLLNQPPMNFAVKRSVHLTEVDFVGSCNGLICLVAATRNVTRKNVIIISNPTIRKSRSLTFSDEFGYESVHAYGFGYDESSDDYKVVAFSFSSKDNWDVLIQIFSLKTSELKRITFQCGSLLMRHSPPSSANGKLHWFAETRPEQDLFIAYLDLATADGGIVEKPDFVTLNRQSLIKAPPGGPLYVICNDGGFTNVWLVEPCYGIGTTTWRNVYGLDCPEAYIHYKNLLVVLDNGEIVALCNGQIEIFNPSNRCVTCYELGAHYFHTGIAYVETLVSPYSTSDKAGIAGN